MSSSLANICKNIMNTPPTPSPNVPPSPSVAPLTAHSDEHVDKGKDKEEDSDDEETEDEDDEELKEEIRRLKQEKRDLEEELKVLRQDKSEFVKREKEIERKTKLMSEYDTYLIQHKKEVLDLLNAEKAQISSFITGTMNTFTANMLQLLNANNAITIGRSSKTEGVEHTVATPTPKAEVAMIVIDPPASSSVSSHVREVKPETPKPKKRKTMTIPVRMPDGWGDEKKWKKHMEDLMWDEYSKYDKR